MNISKEDVIKACVDIAATGIKPTQKLVREAVGGRGSFTTIGRFMGEWDEAQAASGATPAEPLPQAITDIMAMAAAQVWQAAVDAANLGLSAARQEIEALNKKAAEDQVANTEIVAIVENERDEAMAEIERLRAAVAHAEARAERAETKADRADERADRAEARADRAEERMMALEEKVEAELSSADALNNT